MICSLLIALVPVLPQAQDEARAEPLRPTSTASWLRWERLGARVLSPDGRWLAWTIRRGDGTSELRVRMLATEETKSFEEGSSPTFSDDGRWLAWRIGSPEDVEDEPRRDLGLLDLVAGTEASVEGVSGLSFSADGRFLAMDRAEGDDLIVRDLVTGVDTHFGSVGEHAWSDVGAILAMTVAAAEDWGNGLRVWDGERGSLRTLDSADTTYRGLVWREDAADLAVLRERAFEDDEDTTHAILAWRGLDLDRPRATVFDLLASEGGPDQRVVSERRLRWSKAGDALYLGLKDWERKPAELTEVETEDAGAGGKEDAQAEVTEDAQAEVTKDPQDEVEEAPAQPEKRPLRETLDDLPDVEVWHADDIQIVPRQKRTFAGDRDRSYLAVLWLEGPRLVPLADETVEAVVPLEGDRWGLGSDETPHEEEQRFSATLTDLYRVDLATGARELVQERTKYRYTGDPLGRHVLFQKNDQLWVHDLETGRAQDLTGRAPVSFVNQESTHLTDEKPIYGVAGWTTDGRVLVNSRYDLWAFALDGSASQRLTRGAESRVRHRRLVVDDEEEEFIDPTRPFYVSLYGDTTKQAGFGRLLLADGGFERLVWEHARYGRQLARAKGAQVFAYTHERFDDPTDVFVAGPDLDEARQVTALNPQQAEFAWGRAELVDYTNTRGEAMQGALFYPAGWEAGKTYPMITYIYELRSQSLHGYDVPSERSPYSTAVFTSQGYFVLQPDITYRAQNPGVSATECVVPAVKRVLETGLVDPARVGLVGHSWGAYQTAFLVTQTDVFAAGVAGAPLTNMMSMSMSIYWNSGQTDAYIFHESQGRMDRPFWQDVDTYIANSPIFHVDALNTPLLVAFGDEDGAVDWNQGVELYNAARLARKPLVMLVYPGENHGLRKKENQVDYHHRVREWFDHYLNGAEAPAWITRGETWLERERARKDFELENKSKKGRSKKSGDE